MKAWITPFIILSIVIPFYHKAYVQVPGKELSEALEEHELAIDIEDRQVTELLGDIIILPTERYDKESAVEMIEQIGEIHPNILEEIAASGVKLKLFKGMLTEEPMFQHLKGETPKGWSSDSTWEQSPGAGGGYVAAAKIGHSEYGKDHSSLNLELHEIAHSYAQKVYGEARLKTDFAQVWKEEAKQLFPEKDYFLNYMEEYFAETFAMYYYSKETKLDLKEKAPKTYQFFSDLEENPYKWFAVISPKI